MDVNFFLKTTIHIHYRGLTFSNSVFTWELLKKQGSVYVRHENFFKFFYFFFLIKFIHLEFLL